MSKGRIVARGTPTELRSALVEDYLLVDANDRSALRCELQALGVCFSERPQFRIPVESAGVHRLLKSIETPLTMVQVHTPTLEDAYLAIVDRDEHVESDA